MLMTGPAIWNLINVGYTVVVHAFLATNITAHSNLSVAIHAGKWNFSGNISLMQYKNWAWNLATRPEEKKKIVLDDRI
jgi:hypothetical protein